MVNSGYATLPWPAIVSGCQVAVPLTAQKNLSWLAVPTVVMITPTPSALRTTSPSIFLR